MFTVKNVSSLEKIQPGTVNSAPEFNSFSCLKGEKFSYQISFMGDSGIYMSERANVTLTSDLKDYITIYEVDSVPVTATSFPKEYDNGFITRGPALIPDLLTPCDGTTTITCVGYKSLWIKVDLPEDAPAGSHNIKVSFANEKENFGESNFTLNIVDAVLPKQTMKFTEWFHCDCISSYYNVEPLSEMHWQLIDKFMKMAADNGINMLLTPVFTPALDTKIGNERPTVQLTEVAYENGQYIFGFDKLGRWLEMCKKNGIEYIEVSHLFSQWGAEKTPKIVVKENGEEIKKFGWHTESTSDEYKEFLSQFLPAVTEYFKEHWDSKKVYFHISDEPTEAHLERYAELHKFVKPYLEEFNLMDAMSHFEFYKHGLVDTPVSTILTIDDFIENNVKNVWAYNCCAEGKEYLSNRFIAMPSYRNRVIAEMLYKYDIEGFLHWGYNFYYSQLSTKLINPYITNNADYGFPAGDSFAVYPGADGPLPSIRLFVFNDALQDVRAMKLAEELVGKEVVMKLVEEKGEITFRTYPANADYILNLRSKVNDIIAENSNK